MKVIGKNAVAELIKTDKTVDKILVQNGLRDDESRNLVKNAKNRGYKVQFAEKAVLDKECESKRHQGFIAYTSDFKYTEFDELLACVEANENAFLVVADGIEDPHNLGSIIRVCECAGVNGLVIGKHRSAQVTDSVMRISEGSANHLKISRVVNLNSAIDKIKSAGLWTFALELGGSDIYKTDLKGKLCLVIGGEDTGVNKLTKEKCDGVITIPMSGKVNSLNASVALGVGVFEAVRQRKA
ncbi:MAG: 23S rRNA (guanosine(2251)-2'-O)-methyltransferase RlmB [Clostridia bacterium]|nr:23S rRNA (guanosine(2251)-2'-O)-methyltransferase RlmB [Clostridia bacterium]